LRVKVCGITNIEDAKDAIDAGADALGFVFYEPSPRYISPSDAKQIIEQLPPFVQTVGLFVNVAAPQIDFICKLAKIDMAQIHFEADENFFKHLQTKHIKVIRAQSKEDIVNNQNDYCLVDAFVEEYGGMGKRINLEWFEGVDCSKMILAGGLNSQNIHELKTLPFYALDVSSSVELSKGKKDKKKMEIFINTVNEIYS
jgi:phosphoribosylanthranilate isomerase